MTEYIPILPQTVPLQLTDRDFRRISSFIETNTGIRMPETKRMMIQSRLLRRVKTLNFNSFSDYIDYAFSSEDKSEIISMTDILTTNLTEFFREKGHFNIMMKVVLPSLAADGIIKPGLWSAGCSTGEEAYTLSMVMQEYMRRRPGKFSGYEILATDISTGVLEKAGNAVYPPETVETLPDKLKHRYFLKSRSGIEPAVIRVNAETRSRVRFQHLNFMETRYPVGNAKQIIFCRNVLIYFNKQTQVTVIRKLIQNLDTEGFLFLGHSETILGMDVPLEPIAPTVYRKIRE